MVIHAYTLGTNLYEIEGMVILAEAEECSRTGKLGETLVLCVSDRRLLEFKNLLTSAGHICVLQGMREDCV